MGVVYLDMMASQFGSMLTRLGNLSTSDHASVVSINLFVALLCGCIVIGHLLEENRWVNESITALVIVSLWSYFPLCAKKLWAREEYKIMLIFYLRITKKSPQSSLCYCELLFFPFAWLIERVRKINEGNLNFMFYFLLVLDKWRTLLNWFVRLRWVEIVVFTSLEQWKFILDSKY